MVYAFISIYAHLWMVFSYMTEMMVILSSTLIYWPALIQLQELILH